MLVNSDYDERRATLIGVSVGGEKNANQNLAAKCVIGNFSPRFAAVCAQLKWGNVRNFKHLV